MIIKPKYKNLISNFVSQKQKEPFFKQKHII